MRIAYDAKFPVLCRSAALSLITGRKLTVEQTGALRQNRSLAHLLDPEGLHRGKIEIELRPTEKLREFRNALNDNQGSRGAFAVPSGDLLGTTEFALAHVDPFRFCGATVHRTDIGQDHKLGFADMPTTEGYIHGTNAALTEASNIAFGSFVFHAQDYNSGEYVAPNEWVTDTPDALDILVKATANGAGRAQAHDVTNELSVALGNATTTSVTAGSATAISGDDILAALSLVSEGYQEEGQQLYVMAHPNVCRAIGQLKDGNGSYLFPNRRNVFDARLIRNRYLASTLTSGAVSLLVGNFSALHYCDHVGMRFVAADEARLEYNQTVFYSVLRSGFALVQSDAAPAVVRLIH